jgi:hypothetical protein
MAPQAIEIAQNGLGYLSAGGCREGESIRRIPYDSQTSLVIQRRSSALRV